MRACGATTASSSDECPTLYSQLISACRTSLLHTKTNRVSWPDLKRKRVSKNWVPIGNAKCATSPMDPCLPPAVACRGTSCTTNRKSAKTFGDSRTEPASFYLRGWWGCARILRNRWHLVSISRVGQNLTGFPSGIVHFSASTARDTPAFVAS